LLRLCAVLCLVLLLSGCAGQELNFEAIENVDSAPGGLCGDEPGLTVLASPEAVSALESEGYRFYEFERLRALDYDRHFAIAVCRGPLTVTNPSLNPDVRQIIHSGAKVVVQAHFPDIKRVLSEQGGGLAGSLPYRVVIVTKAGRWTRDIHFVLTVDGETVQEYTLFVP
jgi:hypothetical protein